MDNIKIVNHPGDKTQIITVNVEGFYIEIELKRFEIGVLVASYPGYKFIKEEIFERDEF